MKTLIDAYYENQAKNTIRALSQKIVLYKEYPGIITSYAANTVTVVGNAEVFFAVGDIVILTNVDFDEEFVLTVVSYSAGLTTLTKSGGSSWANQAKADYVCKKEDLTGRVLLNGISNIKSAVEGETLNLFNNHSVSIKFDDGNDYLFDEKTKTGFFYQGVVSGAVSGATSSTISSTAFADWEADRFIGLFAEVIGDKGKRLIYPIIAYDFPPAVTVYGNPSSDGVTTNDIVNVLYRNKFYVSIRIGSNLQGVVGGVVTEQDPSAGLYNGDFDDAPIDLTEWPLGDKAMVIDGDKTTEIGSNSGWNVTRESYGLDLGSSKNVSIIKIYDDAGAGGTPTTGSIHVLYGEDNDNWTELEIISNGAALVRDNANAVWVGTLVTPTSARYWRFYISSALAVDHNSIGVTEIEAYDVSVEDLNDVKYFGGFAQSADIIKDDEKKIAKVNFSGFLRELENAYAYEAATEAEDLMMIKGIKVIGYDEDEASSPSWGVHRLNYKFPGSNSITGITIKESDDDTDIGVKRLEFKRPNFFKWNGGSWTAKTADAYDDPNGARVSLTAGDSSKIYCDFKVSDYPLRDTEELINLEVGEGLGLVAKGRGTPEISLEDGESILVNTKFTRIWMGHNNPMTDVVDDEPEIELFDGTASPRTVTFGFIEKFESFEIVGLSNAGGALTGIWEYYQRSGASGDWATLTVTDGTTNLSVSGRVSFDAPNDWTEKFEIGEDEEYAKYYVRYRITSGSPTVTCSQVLLHTVLKSKRGDKVIISTDIQNLVAKDAEDEFILKHNNSNDATIGVWDYSRRIEDLMTSLLQAAGYVNNVTISDTKIKTNTKQINFWGKPPNIAEKELCQAMIWAGNRLYLGIGNKIYYVTVDGDFVFVDSITQHFEIVSFDYNSDDDEIWGLAYIRPIPYKSKDPADYHEAPQSILFIVTNASSGTPVITPMLTAPTSTDYPLDSRWYYRPGAKGSLGEEPAHNDFMFIGRFGGVYNMVGENICVPVRQYFGLRLILGTSDSPDLFPDLDDFWSNATFGEDRFALPENMKLGFFSIAFSGLVVAQINFRGTFGNSASCIWDKSLDALIVLCYHPSAGFTLRAWKANGDRDLIFTFEYSYPWWGTQLVRQSMTAMCAGKNSGTINELLMNYIHWDEKRLYAVTGLSGYGYSDDDYGFQLSILELCAPSIADDGFPFASIYFYNSSIPGYYDVTSNLNNLDSGTTTVMDGDALYYISDHPWAVLKQHISAQVGGVTCTYQVSDGSGGYKTLAHTGEDSGSVPDLLRKHDFFMPFSRDAAAKYWKRDTDANIGATDKYILKVSIAAAGANSATYTSTRAMRRAIWLSYDGTFWYAQANHTSNDFVVIDMIYNVAEDYIYGCMLDRKNIDYWLFSYNCANGRADTATLPYLSQTGFDSYKQLKSFQYDPVAEKVYCVECDVQNEKETARLIQIDGTSTPIATALEDVKTKEWDCSVKRLAIHQTEGIIAGIATPESGYLWLYQDEFYLRILRANYGMETVKAVLSKLLQMLNMVIYIKPDRQLYITERQHTTNYVSNGTFDLGNNKIIKVKSNRIYSHIVDGIIVDWRDVEGEGAGSIERGDVAIDRKVMTISNPFINDINTANLIGDILYSYFGKKKQIVTMDIIALLELDLWDVLKITASNKYHNIDRDTFWNLISARFDPNKFKLEIQLLERV